MECLVLNMRRIHVTKQGEIINEGVKSYHYDNADFYIDGLIYTYGKKAGEETINWIYEEIINKGSIPYNQIKGCYICVIKQDQTVTAFSDNSNMHCLYYSENNISNSFLKMIDVENETENKLSFSNIALCEYLTIGSVYFDNTFFNEINILNSSDYIYIDKKAINIYSKGIGDLEEKSEVKTITEFFEKMAYSISDYQICQALTGGYDSRLIYACLSSKIEDQPTLSSNNDTLADVKCAAVVANANGDKLDVISIPKPEYLDHMVEDIILETDGIEPLDIDTFIRLSTYKKRLSKKYNLLITGDGGVLHKDWEWTQDLPFYRKKKSDSHRFYRQRLCYIDISGTIGSSIKEIYLQQEGRFANKLDMLSKPLNTQSYDSWYYKVSGNRRVYYNLANNDMIMYAPLMELDIVRYSYALPRRKRFFYNSIRDAISKENIKIARIKTNYGTTASNEILFLIRDVFYQGIEYCRKAYRVLGRKLLHRNVLVDSFTGWTLENDVRQSELARNALIYAHQKGLIDSQCGIEDISYELLCRIIHIYWLARKTNNE